MSDARNIRGQALVELSVFGAIFLTILAALISYGLRYNYIVNGHQTAFRRALHIASDQNQGDVTYALIRDKHIPDPVDPFGIGTVLPAVSSASVVRSNRIDAQAADNEGLPTTVMQLASTLHNGVETPAAPLVYKSAGFRWEIAPRGYFDKNEVRKYRLLYSDVMLAKRDGANMIPITEYDPDENDVAAVRIVDTCSGEVISYDDCYSQGVKLVNTAANSPCMVDCNLWVSVNQGQDGMEDVSCPNICNTVTLNPPNQTTNNYNPAIGGPWYLEGYHVAPADATHSRPYYVFPKLDEVFAATRNKQMGMGSRTTQEETKSTTLRKIESSEGMGDQTSEIQTQEAVDWTKTINREFTRHRNLRADGSERREQYNAWGGWVPPAAREVGVGATTTRTYSSVVSEQWREQWTTQK